MDTIRILLRERAEGASWQEAGEKVGLNADAARKRVARFMDAYDTLEEVADAMPEAYETEHRVEVPLSTRAGWEYYLLLTGCHHWDHPACDRQLLEAHHEQARERGAGIVALGDVFCLMQGRNDRRREEGDKRPEHAGKAYIDRVVYSAIPWYGRYAQNYLLISEGNHEESIVRFNETDPLERVVRAMRTEYSSGVALGAYRGFITFAFQDRDACHEVPMFYEHGAGGSAPVTKGVIQTSRRAAAVTAAIMVQAHIHEKWWLVSPKHELGPAGSYLSFVTHIAVASYKEEYLKGRGWVARSGMRPKPVGGVWLRFYWSDRLDRVMWQVQDVEY